MSSMPTGALADSTEENLLSVIDSGIRLSLNNDQLIYKATPGAIAPEQIQRLRSCRHEISTVLRRISALRMADVRSAGHFSVDIAPLAFSQLTHWNLQKLRVRRSARIVASVVRLSGCLDIDALTTAIGMMIERHEALRTSIGTIAVSPVQVIFGSVRHETILDDLTALPKHAREGELKNRIWKYVLEPVDVAKDSLFSTILIKLDRDEHVLIVALDHMISDGMSMAILLRDVLEAYESETSHRPSSLPGISVQFGDYAVWQRRMCERWSEDHKEHWNDILSACRLSSAASEAVLDRSAEFGLGYTPIQLDDDLREELLKWSRFRMTTIVMAVFVAFVALIFRWYEASEEIVQYQTGGRSMMETQNTVGYFAFRLYLRLCVTNNDTFEDLMDRIKAEYVGACEHAEFLSMNVYRMRPAVARSPCFNWLAEDRARSDLGGSKGVIKCSRVPFEDQLTRLEGFETDTKLMVGFSESGGAIRGSVQFPRGMMSAESAERFARNLVAFVRTLLGRSKQQIAQMKLIG